ncbi:hypothetical protein KKG46_01370 [Patescibacteria group bacterium]|nr:hypothetical protein [Patescibacteria group bacterium]
MQLKLIDKQKRLLDKERVKINEYATKALQNSKRAIFALQRQDEKAAKDLLSDASQNITKCRLILKNNPILWSEAAFKACLEEYAEAKLFESHLKGKMEIPKDLKDDTHAILGGLADAAGEIARHAVLRATEHDKQSVEKAHATVLEIVDMLAQLDLTGSLRSKFDQSKSHLRRIEDIRYDLSREK